MKLRMKPYPKKKLTKLTCVRCGKPAWTQWQICADGNQYRPLCKYCDVELNAMVMRWAFKDREEDISKYQDRVMLEIDTK